MKIRLITALIFLIILGCSKTPEQKVDALFEQGIKNLEVFDYDKAEKAFNEIENIIPGSGQGLYGKGLIYERKLLYYDALNIYMTLQDARPNYIPPFKRAYYILTKLGYYEDAMNMAVDLAKIDNEKPESYKILAEAFINLRQFNRSIQELNKAAELGYNNEIINLIRARALLKSGMLDSSRTLVRESLKNDKQSAEFYYELANYYESVGLIDSSIYFSNKSYQQAGNDFEFKLNHFERTLRNKYFYDARLFLDDCKEEFPELVQIGLKLFYDLARDDKIALRSSGSVFREKAGHTLTGPIYEIKARGKVEDLLSISQDSDGLDVILKEGNYSSAFIDFFNYAKTMVQTDYDKSLTTLPKLQAIGATRNNYRDVKMKIAFTMYTVGMFDDALEYMETQYKYHRTSPDWLTGLADIYSFQSIRIYDKAEKLYKEALEADKWYVPAFEGYLNMYIRKKEFNNALALFDKYPHLVREIPYVALLKVRTLLQNDKYSEGLNIFEKTIPYLKGDISQYNSCIVLLSDKKKYEECEKIITIMEKLQNSNPDALVYVADYYSSNKEYNKVFELTQKALEIETENSSASTLRAWAMYHKGQKKEAIEIFEENIKKYHNDARNLLYFSYILAMEKIDFNRASNMAREAVFNSYGDPHYLLNLSLIYYKMERYNLSLGEAIKARNALKTDPIPYYRIGMAMYKLGKEESKENLQKALDYGLPVPDRDTVMSVLKKL